MPVAIISPRWGARSNPFFIMSLLMVFLPSFFRKLLKPWLKFRGSLP